MKGQTELRTLAGITIANIGLWIPFYITSKLPEGWSEDYWWSFPTLMTLWCGGVGLVILGVLVAIFALIPTEEKKS